MSAELGFDVEDLPCVRGRVDFLGGADEIDVVVTLLHKIGVAWSGGHGWEGLIEVLVWREGVHVCDSRRAGRFRCGHVEGSMTTSQMHAKSLKADKFVAVT